MTILCPANTPSLMSLWSSADITPQERRSGRPSTTPSEAAKTVDPRVDAPANLERALAPDAARLQPEDHDPSSVVAAVPEADMGGGDGELYRCALFRISNAACSDYDYA